MAFQLFLEGRYVKGIFLEKTVCEICYLETASFTYIWSERLQAWPRDLTKDKSIPATKPWTSCPILTWGYLRLQYPLSGVPSPSICMAGSLTSVSLKPVTVLLSILAVALLCLLRAYFHIICYITLTYFVCFPSLKRMLRKAWIFLNVSYPQTL